MKKIIGFLFTLIIFETAYSQTGIFPRTVPPAPEAGSIGKYGNLPVGHYNGLPAISIPIHNISVRDASLDISLSYHSAGIQVKEEASWVGLGWNLNAGGAIVRTIRGSDDFNLRGYYNLNYSEHPVDPLSEGVISNPNINNNPAFMFNAAAFGPLVISQIPGLKKNISNIDFDIYDFHTTENDAPDYASDLYYANCGPLTVKFIIVKTPTGNSFQALEHQDIKIEYFPDSGSFKAMGHWLITLANGTKYIFGDSASASDSFFTQKTASKTIEADINTDLSNGGEAQFDIASSDDNYHSVTCWFLEKIETPSGEKITFEYTGSAENDVSKTAWIIQIPDLSEYKVEDLGSGGCASSSLYNGRKIVSYILQKIRYLSKISFSNGYILFERDNLPRADLTNAQRLKYIKVYQTFPDLKLIKEVELNHDYYDSSTDTRPTFNSKIPTNYGLWLTGLSDKAEKRLRLQSVATKNINTTFTGQSLKYELIYNNSVLPKKTSYNVDLWGYPIGNIRNLFSFIPEVKWDNQGIYYYNEANQTSQLVIAPSNIFSGSNRNSDPASIVSGILYKIIYPTGGSTQFDFESNEYMDTQDNTIKKGGGCRIAKTIDHDQVTGKTTSTNYVYSGGKIMSPVKNFLLNFCLTTRRVLAPDPNCSKFESFFAVCGPLGGYLTTMFPKLYRYGNVIYPLSSVNSSTTIGYDKVEVIKGENSDMGKTGKSSYQFINLVNKIPDPNSQGFVNTPSAPPSFENLQNGSLTSIQEFEFDGLNGSNQPMYRLLSETNNTYIDVAVNHSNNTKAIWQMVYNLEPLADGYLNIHYVRFAVNTGWNTIKTSTTTLYNRNNPPVSTTVNYFYLPEPPSSIKHHNLVRKTTTSSNGTILSNVMTYPGDYTDASLNGLKNNSITGVVIENKTTIGDASGPLINGSIAKYNALGQPVESYKLEVTAPTTVPFNAANVIPGAAYKLKSKLEYDSANNLATVYGVDDSGSPFGHTTYIYGYGGKLPIAEITNATFAETSSALTSNGMSLTYFHTVTDETLIRTKINVLRDALPNAHIRSLLYDPLIGVKEITSPNRIKETYEYDGFNRLANIRDKDGNLIKSYRYQNALP
ncbi:hypothetical protein GVN16_19540 [Emticicia sp. CRIBPO]|uniref:hypothetical protein n=1 Tax=Emticicia sp. CRIBPO TaxID=2683258 RepID=UPI0014131BAB|nr:hypothetical protein [Emticicia sp. CRIBPO]NBA87973.1 hypothetical protein [Emticicia sp. CRIBPO]